MPSSVLVTGGTGFVGCHLVRALLQQGHVVHLVVRSASRPFPAAFGQPILHSYDGNIRDLIDIVRSAAPATIFHLASHILAEHGQADVDVLVDANVLFGTQLAEAAVAAGVRKFINTGTFWEHYQGEDYNPVCLYAATKKAFEDILVYYLRASGMRGLTLELSDTYGPCDRRPKLFHSLRQADITNKPLDMTAGEQLLDLVYVDDVVAAYLHAVNLLDELDPPPQKYAVSAGKFVSLRQVVATYEKVLGRTLPIVWGARPYRRREVMIPWRGTVLPGWRPRVNLAEGLQRLVHAYAEHPDECRDFP